MDLKRVKKKPMGIREKCLKRFQKKKYEAKLKAKAKAKSTSIRTAGNVGTTMMTEQIEGGEEFKQASTVAYTAAEPVIDVVSKGKEFYQQKAMDEKEQKLKSVRTNNKKLSEKKQNKRKEFSYHSTISKKEPIEKKKDISKRNTFSRERKIRFFLDKMQEEEKQKDSLAKVAKDIFTNQLVVKAKQFVSTIGGFLAAAAGIVAITVVPVVLIIALVYHSPMAVFFPPLESGDTVVSVASAYVAEFNQEVSELALLHQGHDAGEVIYVDYEGEATSPSNLYDIIVVYMMKHGIGNTATVMNDTAKAWINDIVEDMCTYTTISTTGTVENEDGTESTADVLQVRVTLKTYRDMVTVYGLSEDEAALMEEMMRPESLVMLGYMDTGGGNSQSSLSVSEITSILSGITDPTQRLVCSFALSKVGYPYSQAYRDSGSYYDCSSLAYYSWKAAGINISHGGSTTAASEGQGLEEAGKTVAYSEMQPGDLIFFSYTRNGRYRNISHVAIYVGNGKVVEAKNERYGVVYGDVPNISRIVLIGRP